MCDPRHNGPKPENMLPVGTKASIIVYAPERADSEDYRVFEGEITRHFTNNACWNYSFSESIKIEDKESRGGASYLGTYGHRQGGGCMPEIRSQLLSLAGDKVYALYVNDWGTDHHVPGIQYIYILTTLPVEKGIEKLKEIVREYKFYICAEAMRKIKESYGE